MFLTAFILWPIAEVFVFALVVKATSLATAFYITFATSFLGLLMLRSRRRLASVEYSARSLENYVYANLGALALIIPGFISDLFGLVVSIPPTRRFMFAVLKRAGLGLYERANGPFSVFRAFRFGDSLTPNDDAIDIGSRAVDGSDAQEDVANSSLDPDDSEPIDVEFTVRD